jgi:tagatose-1,6-bisphosphate aldolase non-catalytic subunit AgaZ/GatZ
MTASLSMPDFFTSLTAFHKEQNLKSTLLGIGPMSKRIVRVTLQIAKRRNFPIMFIASRNQVDLRGLGGGYVCSWDQGSFIETIGELAEQVQFSGLCYVCRDHGGPWQRDSERREKLPSEAAMETAKRSYLEDLLQGFDLLHIDPTKDPHAVGSNELEPVIERTVDLIEYVEKERRKRGLPEISYEVGTEETSGGLTSPEVYESFIKRLNAILARKGLPLPAFIVGQTGTLVRMTENVGRFDAGAAEALSRVAAKHGAGLKEHNADYLADSSLLQHPVLGITAANVAPEFGVVETAAYLELGLIEAAVRGSIASGESGWWGRAKMHLSKRWKEMRSCGRGSPESAVIMYSPIPRFETLSSG